MNEPSPIIGENIKMIKPPPVLYPRILIFDSVDNLIEEIDVFPKPQENNPEPSRVIVMDVPPAIMEPAVIEVLPFEKPKFRISILEEQKRRSRKETII